MDNTTLDIICNDIDRLSDKFIEEFEPWYYYRTNADTKKVRVFIFDIYLLDTGERFSSTIIIENTEDNNFHIEITTSGAESSVEEKTIDKVYDFFIQSLD